MTRTCVAAWVTTMLVAGCGGVSPDGAKLGTSDDAATSDNGKSLNGKSLNGKSPNGKSLNGKSLNGMSLNGTTLNGKSPNGTLLNGRSPNGVGIDGTIFHGTVDGDPVSGEDFVGSTWVGELSDGDEITLAIDAMSTLAAPNGDMHAYSVTYLTEDGWEPLCDGANQAVPLSGTWNYEEGVPGGGSHTADATRFSFACRGYAVAKCVELGYRPWEPVAEGSSTTMREHMVACVRALRADYCGDGTSHTVDGTLINLYDGIGVQADTESFAIEAEWSAAGAVRVSDPVHARLMLSVEEPPQCYLDRVSSTTGDTANFAAGTLVMNEYFQE